MRLTPRKNEWQAVLSILESDNEFETLADMAKEIVETVAGEFAKRDWFAFVQRISPSSNLAVGPFSSAREAEKYARFGIASLPTMVLKVYSPNHAINAEQEIQERYNPRACACGHPKHLHDWPKAGPRCVLPRCACKAYSPS